MMICKKSLTMCFYIPFLFYFVYITVWLKNNIGYTLIMGISLVPPPTYFSSSIAYYGNPFNVIIQKIILQEKRIKFSSGLNPCNIVVIILSAGSLRKIKNSWAYKLSSQKIIPELFTIKGIFPSVTRGGGWLIQYNTILIPSK